MNKYELIEESVWNTYSKLAYILLEALRHGIVGTRVEVPLEPSDFKAKGKTQTSQQAVKSQTTRNPPANTLARQLALGMRHNEIAQRAAEILANPDSSPEDRKEAKTTLGQR